MIALQPHRAKCTFSFSVVTRQLVLTGLAMIVLLAAQLSTPAAELPAGFAQTQVLPVLTLSSPTAMAFAPDGRLFICEQAGTLRVVKDGVLLATPFVTINVDVSSERGLLGIAFDPDFFVNHYVYVYYTVNSAPYHNRVSRFTADGDVAVPGSETLILRLEDLQALTHNAGALHFGPDGKLYIAVGDNVRNMVAQRLDNLFGKILRINPDGTIPEDNPFYNTPGARQEIWALGLRNPFTFAIQPGTGKMYINDVGLDSYEEVNEGVAGGNYGWPICEGSCNNPSFLNPVFAYAHDSDCSSVAGAAFYDPPVSQFPQQYVGKYFFSDWCRGWFKMIEPATNAVSQFGQGDSWGVVDLAVSPDGSLYYVDQAYGYLNKIEYTASLVPSISTHPADKTVPEGQPATFSVVASGAQPLTYQWQKNGASIGGATSTNYTLNSATPVDNGAKFRVVVTNSYGTATTNEATLTVTLNHPPTGTITLPVAGTTWRAGDTITFAGEATDFEDGTLPASAFTWKVDFHHDEHAHPFMAATSGITGGSFTIPTSAETSSTVWYRIYLTVTDSRGLTHTSFREVLPQKSTMTLTTNVAGLQVTLDGIPQTTPASIVGVVGIMRSLGVITPQTVGGATYDFTSWSDGGEPTHTISTPAANTTYTANFTPRPAVLQLSSANYSVAENGNSFQITVQRTINTIGAISVTYTTSDGSAKAGADYTATTGTLNFADGEASKTIIIPISNDLVFEGPETLNIALSNPSANVVLGNPSSAVATILDDEATPTLSINNVNIGEGIGGTVNAVFTVSLSVASIHEVTVGFVTADGTASGPSDYLPQSGTLVFPAGETGKTISISVSGDMLTENAEVFYVNLSSPTNATFLSSQGVAVILDNRTPVLITEEATGRAVALESVLLTREPFSLTENIYFHTDQRRRIILFAANVRLNPGDPPSAVTVRAEDSQMVVYPLTVEYVGPVSGFDWLTQIAVKLPDQIANFGDVQVSVTVGGQESNKAPITIKP